MLGEFQAQQSIESVGYKINALTPISEGTSHDAFVVVTGERSMIARFEKPTVDGGIPRDFIFNGRLSLQREGELMSLVRRKARLPAPTVIGLYENTPVPFLLVEQMPGVHWSQYLENTNFSRESFLQSMGFLGEDLARAHQVEFSSFGDVVSQDRVNPGTVTRFVDRLQMTTGLQISRAHQSQAFTDRELRRVTGYFNAELTTLEGLEDPSQQRPVLVLTDLHPRNFLVDKQGKPSGYFDLETCQAARPSVEIAVIRETLFSYFDESASQAAEAAFLDGYREGGGRYNPDDPVNQRLERVLSVSNLLSYVGLYQGRKDDLRDTWSEEFKQIMFDSMERGRVDYLAMAGVVSKKTQQPRSLS